MNEQIGSQNPASVLMVDDTPANLELLSVMLKGRGYKVRAAVSGELALQAVRNVPPDLILLDIMMPEMDGYTLQGKLQEIDGLSRIPIIILTARGQMKDLFELSSNIFAFVEKPFEPKNLVKIVKDAVASRPSVS